MKRRGIRKRRHLRGKRDDDDAGQGCKTCRTYHESRGIGGLLIVGILAFSARWRQWLWCLVRVVAEL